MLLNVFDSALDGSQHHAGNVADRRAEVQCCRRAVMLADGGKLIAVQIAVRVQAAAYHRGIGDAARYRVSQEYRCRVFVEFLQQRPGSGFLVIVEVIL
ncbi:hypothetical protein D7X33_11325 [Butyricicoccus sp. 1XD8-22]|nr:hypothetical protein D7X33_11325 [Butyricicoccus sp. 1XD8-22]